MHYNYVKVHQTLRVTPAMEAGITDHVWTIAEMIKNLNPNKPTTRLYAAIFRKLKMAG